MRTKGQTSVIDFLKVDIKDRRIHKGLSQKALGDTIGVSRHAILRYESGEYLPSAPNLIKLARLFEVKHPADLLVKKEFDFENLPSV